MVAIAGEIADQCSQQINRRHNPVQMAIFIMDHRHRGFGLLEHAQSINRVQLIGNHLGLGQQVFEPQLLASNQMRQNLAHFDNADNLVGRAIGDRQKRMSAFLNRSANLALAC